MNILDLMVVDEVSDVLLTDDKEYNIGRLTKSTYQVQLPKKIEKGDKVIHIRPSTIIVNPNIKIPKEYWSEELKAYLSNSKFFMNRKIEGITITVDDLNLNDEFKKTLEVGNPVFQENPVSEELNSLGYFNKYGISTLDEYLFMKNHMRMEYKPSRFKFLNIFDLFDGNESYTDIVQCLKNNLNPISETDENNDKINHLILIGELFEFAFYSGIVYDKTTGNMVVSVKNRTISFKFENLDKVIRRYSKLINKAKSKQEGNYLDEALLYLLTITKSIMKDLLNRLSKDDGEIICLGGLIIGRKIMGNQYDLDFDYKLAANFFLVLSKNFNNLNIQMEIINSLGPRNINTYLSDNDDYFVANPIKFLTSFEEIKLFLDKINEGDYDWIQSELVNKYLISSYSEKIKYPWLKQNPQGLEITYYTCPKNGLDYKINTFILINNEYKKFYNKELNDGKI